MAKNINNLWASKNKESWKDFLNKYWQSINSDNFEIEKEMDSLCQKIKEFEDINDWYDFLFNKYFPWKYTAKNRLTTTRMTLKKKHESSKKELDEIIKSIFTRFKNNPNDIKGCLEQTKKNGGLGVAGASGLLSVLFPGYFGTVDQFVAENIVQIEEFKDEFLVEKIKNKIEKYKNISLEVDEGVFLISAMKDKAKELNKEFNTDFWTPRKIDMVLWGYRE